MSLDAAEIDLSQAFAPGQGYVALSRLRTLEGLVLLNKIGKDALRMHPYVIEFDQLLRKDSYKWERVIARFNDDALQKMYDTHIKNCGGITNTAEIERYKTQKRDAKENLSTIEKTRRLLEKADTLEDIATQRGLKLATIIGHIETLIHNGEKLDLERFNTIPEGDFGLISQTFKSTTTESLTPAFKKLGGKYSYEDLKLARLFIDK